jgi:squalene-hopene/tetraprenyl-beta-curcumene cyclase
MMLEALRDSGLPKDDPVYRKALVFIGRCQMLGESNDQPFARGSNQGGFIYSPANGGESKAGEFENGGRKELRCYGSMTYAGFKSMLYADLKKDDRRVKAALDWISRHWTLDYNPNMPAQQSKQGLFYYYHVFGRALAAWGADVVEDHFGREHAWRRELVEKLAMIQRDDGSWVNEADRWMEGHPALTTAYAMLALQVAFP